MYLDLNYLSFAALGIFQLGHCDCPKDGDSKSPASDSESSASKIEELEDRIRDLEARSPKKYPDVKFLTYKDRKRILVSSIIR
jgi:hypothetical protein